MSQDLADQKSKPAWATAFPEPKSSPPNVTHDVLKEMIEESAQDEDTGFVIVDVRRTDFEGLCVKNAVNLPAQSFFYGLSTWSKVFADRTVIFYCSSSNGRGPRCASWYQDFLDKHNLPGEAAILQGGIKEWTKQYAHDQTLTTAIPESN